MSTRILAEMVEHERESLAEYEARVRNAQADVEAQRARLRRREAALAAALDEQQRVTRHGYAHKDDGSECVEPAWCQREHVRTRDAFPRECSDG